MASTARGSAWLTSSSRCRVSQAPAAVLSAALSVVRQLPNAQPQVERAACGAEVLPRDEPPRKWNPPDSCPVRCSSGPAKLADRAKARRLLPRAGAATDCFQAARLPAKVN